MRMIYMADLQGGEKEKGGGRTTPSPLQPRRWVGDPRTAIAHRCLEPPERFI